ARNSVRTLQASPKKSQIAVDAAETAAQNLDSLKAKLRQHHEIRNDVERKPDLVRELEKSREQSVTAKRRVAEVQADVKAKTTKATLATDRVEQLRAEAKAFSYDAALHGRLERLRAD